MLLRVAYPSLSCGGELDGCLGACPLLLLLCSSFLTLSMSVERFLTLVHLVEAVAIILTVDTVDFIEDVLLDGLEDYSVEEGTKKEKKKGD